MSGQQNRKGRGKGRARRTESSAGRGSDSVGNPVVATAAFGATPFDVQTVGVRRPGYGTGGIPTLVTTNHVEVGIRSGTIHHYDGKR